MKIKKTFFSCTDIITACDFLHVTACACDLSFVFTDGNAVPIVIPSCAEVCIYEAEEGLKGLCRYIVAFMTGVFWLYAFLYMANFAILFVYLDYISYNLKVGWGKSLHNNKKYILLTYMAYRIQKFCISHVWTTSLQLTAVAVALLAFFAR